MKKVPFGKILLIDDDLNLTIVLKRFLELKNFNVQVRYDGTSGLQSAKTNRYDLIIIDITLPHINGFSLLEKLRLYGIDTPTIMTSDKYSLDFEIESYKLGTNLFHKKPIEFRLLEVQVKSLIQNNYKEIFQVGDIKLDLDSRTIYKQNKSIHLTKLEFALFMLFLKSNGKLYSRDEILTKVFYSNKECSYSAVDTLISRLRKKLGDLEGENFIETVFKSGYRMNKFYLQ